MAYRRMRRLSRRRSSYRRTTIPGTRVPRRGAVKEFPKYAAASVSRRQIHFWPTAQSGMYQLVFANNDAPIWIGTNPPGQLLAAAGSPSASAVFLNNIVQGTAIDQRSGSMVYMRNLMIRGVIQPRMIIQASTQVGVYAANYPYGEILLVYDREPDQHLTTVPPLSDILEQGTNMSSPQRLDTRDRFDILFRKKLSFLVDGTSDSMYYSRGNWIDMKIPINRSCTFAAGATAPANPGLVRKGTLLIYFLSFLPNTLGHAPVFQGYMKLSFTDMD